MNYSTNHPNMDKKYSTNFKTFLIKISIKDFWDLQYPQNGVKMTLNFPNNNFGNFEHNICSEFRARKLFI